jgi:hypothetical protein
LHLGAGSEFMLFVNQKNRVAAVSPKSDQMLWAVMAVMFSGFLIDR